MQELNKYLEVFHKIIDDLNEIRPTHESNVRLGGSLILKLHGLNFSRKSDDLDIILNNTSPFQKDYIKAMSNFRVDETYGNEDINYKFAKNGLCLNILLVNQLINCSPITYKFRSKYYDIVPISEIIQAKARYGRKKDLSDLILLKNENFNL
jgi:hypothetical protein